MLSTKDIIHEIWKAAKSSFPEQMNGKCYWVEAVSDEGLLFRAVVEEGTLVVTDESGEDITKPLTFDSVEDLQKFLKYFL
ncbi:hypothetical protein AVV29_gp016 [Vibrio phage phi 3]|uniref:Uncharacterized protein n=1 Tax=Vibrio phage phi 3 TaxID=1589298 RepID=A0A0B5HAL9_9CAUD|nr:hypothetical protein AVV29_gp016 [Vibrio phage phi 3]AJF40784.1 hypothetical protein SBVP3_0016 [Vibrio phage phi 3]